MDSNEQRLRLQKVTGTNKGIQGWNNSCYLDATLFSLFYSTKYFDSICWTRETTDELEQRVRSILCERIILSLRSSPYFCSYHQTNTLRYCLAVINSKMSGRMMDVDEFLANFFDVLHIEPFLKYAGGTVNFIHQILTMQQSTVAGTRCQSTLQKLFEDSMSTQQLRLTTMPSPAFFVKMPRMQGRLVGLKLIVPNLVLDFSPVLDSSDIPSASRKMELLAVICIKNNHYTTFTRDSQADWIFFDSMASAGVPTVSFVPRVNEFINSLSSSKVDLTDHGLAQIPGNVLKLFTDVHVCIYVPLGVIQAFGVKAPTTDFGKQSQEPISNRNQLFRTPAPSTVSTVGIQSAVAIRPNLVGNRAPLHLPSNSNTPGSQNAVGKDLNPPAFLTIISKAFSQLQLLITDVILPPYFGLSRNSKSRFGVGKGIQSDGYSTQVDCVIFALFSSVTLLDSTLLQKNRQEPSSLGWVISELLDDIAFFLRKRPFHCPTFKINELRNLLAVSNPNILSQTVSGAEFLTTLLQLFRFAPCICYLTGTASFVHQLILPPTTNERIGYLQDLFNGSLRTQHLSLQSAPSPILIIQMPRSNGVLIGYDYIVPNLRIKIKSALQLQGDGTTMNLLAVICSSSRGFVSYVFGQESQCTVYDTIMETKPGSANQYYIPRVSKHPDFCKWLKKLESRTLKEEEFTDKLKFLLGRSYICMYTPSS